MKRPLVHLHFDSIDSTSSYAKRCAAELDPNVLTLITADEQTSGRGRFERKWLSPKGVNLYATYCWQVPASTPNLHLLSLRGAHCLAKILFSYGLYPTIKEPNDLLLNQKKIAGILTEIQWTPQTAQIFLGIGININMTMQDLAQIDQPATSLLEATGHVLDRTLLQMQITNILNLEIITTNS